MMNKDRMDTIVKITERADKMGLLVFDRLSLIMDLECTDNEFNLRLDELLTTDDYNFAHDICGIQRHIDRKAKTMGDFFVPRFATNE